MYAEKKKLHEREKSWRPGQLRTIALDVTSKCNMACPHCYADPFMNREMVDLDTLAQALEEAWRLGVIHYVLQGGEPTVSPKRLAAIIGMIHPEETFVNVVSNGWNMDRDVVRWLRELQVDKITLSLDSGLEKEHDQNRAEGSFARVVRAIDMILAEGLVCSISTVVTHETLYGEGFAAACRLAQEKGIRVDVQIAMPVGNWEGDTRLLISEKDARFISELRTKVPPLANGRPMLHRDVYRGDEVHCPAGTEFVAITADGHVLPCNFLQHSFGRIGERSLARMRENMLRCHWFGNEFDHCLGGENHEYISKCILPFVKHEKPVPAGKVYGQGSKELI